MTPPASIVHNCDCMTFMRTLPDKAFDLAICDPPYGIGEDGLKNHSRGCIAKSREYTPKDWDKSAPDKAVFDEIIRVSRNQIIFGANHFIDRIPYPSSCWIVWDKENGATDFADCELAWTSFPTAVRKFAFRWQGMLQGDMKHKEERIHPTQKPIRCMHGFFAITRMEWQKYSTRLLEAVQAASPHTNWDSTSPVAR